MTYEDSEVCLYLLVHTLCLAISLWVVGGGRSQLNSEESHRLMGEVGHEGRSAVMSPSDMDGLSSDIQI